MYLVDYSKMSKKPLKKSQDIQKTIFLNKRTNQFDNEIRTVRDYASNVPRLYGDRFIPRRYTITNNSEKRTPDEEKPKDFMETRLEPGYWRSSYFERILKNVLNLNETRILKLTDPDSDGKISINQKPYGNLNELDWPCKPRIRPMAISESCHTLPSFSENSYYNVIAWSSKGEIAASFMQELVIWETNSDSTVIYDGNQVTGIEFNPAGNILAIACVRDKKPVVELWRLSQQKTMSFEREFTLPPIVQNITSIVWEQNEKSMVFGAKNGYLYLICLNEKYGSLISTKHSCAVNCIKFSSKQKYLASVDIKGNILIWKWDPMILHMKIKSKRSNPRKIAWHPWSDGDIIICNAYPATIDVLHVPSKEFVANYRRNDYNCSIHAVTFNKLSGELVVSFFIEDANNHHSTEILVMASLNRVVDILRSHAEIVKYLIWSPDGMQLGTAGSDDTFNIWNFFARKVVKKKEKIPKLIPSTLSLHYYSIK